MPTALLVDDSRTIRMLLREAMLDLGFDVVEADDGAVAIARLAGPESTFDVVLLDRRLPRVDGMGVLRAIRADPLKGALPVVMITADPTAEDVAEALGAGASEVLRKPVRAPALARTLEALGLLPLR